MRREERKGVGGKERDNWRDGFGDGSEGGRGFSFWWVSEGGGRGRMPM